MIYRPPPLPWHYIFVPAQYVARANALAHQIGIEPDPHRGTLTIPLIPMDGPDDAEPTHWGVEGQMPEHMRAELWHMLTRTPAEGEAEHRDIGAAAVWLRTANHGDADCVREADGYHRRVIASHDDLRVGEMWSWVAFLAAAELRVRPYREDQPNHL